MLYADRRAVAGDLGCEATFGGNSRACAPIVTELQKLYPAQGPATAGIQDVCANLRIDVVIAKDTDHVWTDRQSWVWKERPLYRNRYIRLFSCANDHLSVR